MGACLKEGIIPTHQRTLQSELLRIQTNSLEQMDKSFTKYSLGEISWEILDGHVKKYTTFYGKNDKKLKGKILRGMEKLLFDSDGKFVKFTQQYQELFCNGEYTEEYQNFDELRRRYAINIARRSHAESTVHGLRERQLKSEKERILKRNNDTPPKKGNKDYFLWKALEKR